MATLGQIRNAIKPLVEGENIGLKVYPRVPSTPTARALVVRPATADFDQAMRKGNDQWFLDLVLLMASSNLDVAQQHLDEYIDGAGPKSIRSLIFANRTLGLERTAAHVSGLVFYGQLEEAEYPHLAGILRMFVITKPEES